VLLGPANQLAACAPPPSTIGIQPLDSAADADRILGELSAAGVDATFILDSPDLTAEPLAQARGLEPGLDYLELRDHEEIAMLVSETRRAPRALRRLRLRGRAKVETLRASSLIPRVLADLQADVAVFGERHPEPR
jgi:hypothetical protein